MASKPKRKKYAVESYFRDANGKLLSVLVDAETGLPVENPADYTNISRTDYDIMQATGKLPTDDEVDTDNVKPKTSPTQVFPYTKAERGGERSGSFGKTSKRDASNNYGFRSTPMALKAAGLLAPGIAGTVASLGAAGMGLNNRFARQALREDLGLTDPKKGSFLDRVGNFITGNDEGYAGDKKIGSKDYGVSLGNDGMASGGGVVNGRTTLTPNEAQTRSSMKSVAEKNKFGSTKLSGPQRNAEVADSRAVTNRPATTLPNREQVRRDVLDPVAAPDNVSYNLGGAQRNKPMNKRDEAKLKDAVASYFGPDYEAEVTSAKGTLREKDGSISKTGNHNHPLGTAGDFGVKNKVTGEYVSGDQLADFGAYAATKGFTGLGFAADYMGLDKMHLDTNHPNLTTWGKNQGPYPGMTEQAQTNVARGFGLPGPGAPTPTPRPDFTPAQEGVSVAQSMIDQAKTPMSAFDFDPRNATPAQLANAGMVPRTQQEKNMIALALAGELSPQQRKALANDEPEAIAEFANMMASLENRTAVTGDLGVTLDPTQYNSMSKQNLKNTLAGYEEDGPAILAKIDGFYSGQFAPTDPNINSYFNADLVTPDWDNESFNKVGQHQFGFVGNWQKYNQDFFDQRAKTTALADMSASALKGVNSVWGGIKDFASKLSPVGSNRPATNAPGDVGGMARAGGMTGKGSPSAYGGGFSGGSSGGKGNPSAYGGGFSGGGKGNPSGYGGGFSGSSGTAGKGNPSGYGGGFAGTSGSTSSNYGRSDTPSSGKSSFGGGLSTDKDKDSHAGKLGF